MLTSEQKLKLQNAGYSPDKISAYEQIKISKGGQNQVQQSQEPGFTDRLKGDYLKRGQDVISDINRPAQLMNQGASPLKVAGAVGEAGLRTVGNVIGAAFDPLVEAVSPVVKPVVEKIAQIPGIQGGVQALSQWAEKHPEATKDLDAIFNIATLGGGEAAEPVVKDLAAGAVKGAGKVAEKTVAPVGRALKGAGEAAYGLTVPLEESTSKALMAHQAEQGSLFNRIRGELTGTTKGVKPTTQANTAARYGLAGTEREIGIQAKQYQDKLWEQTLAPKLGKVKEITDMRQFIDELGDEIVQNTPELGRRQALLDALEDFKEPFKKVGKIGGTKLQEYKQGWAEFIPGTHYKTGKPIAGALKDVRALAANKARKLIYENVGKAGKQAYIDYGNLESIVKSGIKSSTGDAAKRSFGRNVWEFIMDKAVTPIATMSGKVLYKTGEGLEFVGKSGAKRVGDIINGSDNLLDAAGSLTKDLPMGLGIKDVSKGVKAIDEATKKELVNAIDYIRVGKKKAGENLSKEMDIRNLADKYNITSKSLNDVANKFEDLVSKTKTMDRLPGR